MTVTAAVIGNVDGADVTGYRIGNGVLRLELWDFGATLVSLEIPDGRGGWVDVVLRRVELGSYTDPNNRAGYLGATIGRYANRIADRRIVLDDRMFALTANEGSNHLHGGRVGFDQRGWSAASGDDAVTFTLVSEDGDQGYPGRLAAEVKYRLDGPVLEISYTAVCDAPTVVNLTNHAYWNLAGRGTVADHVLSVDAAGYLPVDEASIPTGEVAPVDGTRFDLRRATQLADAIAAGGFDHCYMLDSRRQVRDVAHLIHPPSGRSMTVATDQPALQVYTANYLVPPHTAVCLETQRPPNAPNMPHLGASALRPGDTYRHRTTHTFSGPGLP